MKQGNTFVGLHHMPLMGGARGALQGDPFEIFNACAPASACPDTSSA